VLRAGAQRLGDAVAELLGARTLETPAEEVRRRYRTQGFDALLLDEQQWTM
jgi:hypothetical protein